MAMGLISNPGFLNVPSRPWTGTIVAFMVLAAASIVGARALLLRGPPAVARRKSLASTPFFWPRCLGVSTAGTTASPPGGGEAASLPPGAVKYSQVPSVGSSRSHFTATTIPKGLLKDHSTKAGTWGVIRVDQGRLLYVVEEGEGPGGGPRYTIELIAPARGIIEPTVRHRVEPLSDDVQFVVEFHRLPNTGPVDERREGL